MNVDLIQLIADSGPTFLLALFAFLVVKGKYIVLARELEKCEKEKNEYKAMAFKAVGLGERLADVAKESGDS